VQGPAHEEMPVRSVLISNGGEGGGRGGGREKPGGRDNGETRNRGGR